MTSSDKAKPDDDRKRAREERVQQEAERDPAAVKQRPADPELADIEDLREVEKRSS